MYKQDLALNNLKGLTCHKTQPINHVLRVSAMLGITVIFKFQSFFSYQTRSRYLSSFHFSLF